MPKKKKTNWQPWDEEIKRYAARETEGLDRDLKALEDHIKKLRKICPKDSAGYPLTKALAYLSELQTRLNGVKGYLARA